MHLHLRAEGINLGESHAKTLDDEFFLSHPAAYFASRISALLAAERDTTVPTPETEADFFAALNLSNSERALQFESEDRRLQVAVEALSLRHQAAEALVRFLYAVTAAKPKDGDAPSAWLAVADSPIALLDAVKKTVAALNDDPNVFLRALFPVSTVVDANVGGAADTAVQWMNHAISLLTGDELSVNAANNKVKHGLAVSARGDVRIELMTAAPDDLGKIPVSAFGEGKSIPIFDRPMLTYLGRPHTKPRRGLEAVSLRVEVPIVLAEAWMIANVYAAIFHMAARRHFDDDLPEGVAPYPTLVVGRLPEHVIGHRPLGYRASLTLPPDGTTAPRPDGLFFHRSFMPMQIDYDSMVSGVVVEGERAVS